MTKLERKGAVERDNDKNRDQQDAMNEKGQSKMRAWLQT